MAMSLFSRCIVFMCVVFPVVFAQQSTTMHVLNATGGSFPAQLYSQATFFYQFVDPTSTLTYNGPDSTAGKCNAMVSIVDFSCCLFSFFMYVMIVETITDFSSFSCGRDIGQPTILHKC